MFSPPNFKQSAVLLIIFLSMVCLHCRAASFACGPKNSFTETLICTDTSLSAKDSSMANIYKNLLRRGFYSESRTEFKREQRNWIKTRNACKTADCLVRLYDERIKALEDYNNQPYEVKVRPPKCSNTTISEIGSRLASTPAKESGTFVRYTNGESGVSYDYIPSISERSKINDPVRVCLVSLYLNCPANDDRGKTYRSTNLRTGEQWELGNSQHICSGA